MGHKTHTHTHAKLLNRFQHVSFVGAFFMLLYLKILPPILPFVLLTFLSCLRVFPTVATDNDNGSVDVFKTAQSPNLPTVFETSIKMLMLIINY